MESRPRFDDAIVCRNSVDRLQARARICALAKEVSRRRQQNIVVYQFDLAADDYVAASLSSGNTRNVVRAYVHHGLTWRKSFAHALKRHYAPPRKSILGCERV